MRMLSIKCQWILWLLCWYKLRYYDFLVSCSWTLLCLFVVLFLTLQIFLLNISVSFACRKLQFVSSNKIGFLIKKMLMWHSKKFIRSAHQQLFANLRQFAIPISSLLSYMFKLYNLILENIANSSSMLTLWSICHYLYNIWILSQNPFVIISITNTVILNSFTKLMNMWSKHAGTSMEWEPSWTCTASFPKLPEAPNVLE